MKYYFLILIAFLNIPFIAACQNAAAAPLVTEMTVTKIFIVRHADRLGQADDLSPAGLVRANELKRMFGKAGIDSIFSTDFNRTKKTAKPLADLRGLPTIIYTTEPLVAARILTNSKGKRVMVVGHSNTVANIIQNCGCTPPGAIVPNIPDTQFDNLFEVIVQKVIVNGATTTRCEVIPMKYGGVTN